MYYVALNSFSHGDPNPFSKSGKFGKDWSGFFILDRDDNYSFTGKGKTDLFTYQFSRAERHLDEKIADFIRYESSQNRKVIISGPANWNMGQFVSEALSSTPLPNNIRKTDSHYIVHSTSIDAGKCILKDRQLRSARNVFGDDSKLNGLRFSTLGEPLDYNDHIWFGELDDDGPEVVVAQRQANAFIEIVSYQPGYRFYFDNYRIIKDSLDLRVIGGTRVKTAIELDKYCVMAICAADLPKRESWTPIEFTKAADEQILGTYRRSFKEEMKGACLGVDGEWGSA